PPSVVRGLPCRSHGRRTAEPDGTPERGGGSGPARRCVLGARPVPLAWKPLRARPPTRPDQEDPSGVPPRSHRGVVVVLLRMSNLFLRTLREDPADAEVPSHKLLVRGGFVRRTAPGVYSWLPLGKIVLENVAAVVREEMNRIGAQEVLLPALLPREYYEATGRWTEYGDTLFRLKDRRGADYLLGPTHEELFTLLVKGEYSSY